MTTHRRRTITLLISAAALAVLAGCGEDSVAQAGPPAPAATASASPTASPTVAAVPGFLAGTDLPEHPTSVWFAGKVTAGQPEYAPFCLEDVLTSQKQLWSRAFGTEFDTHATQVVVRTASEADAKALADALADAAQVCVEDWLADNPDGSGEAKDFGAPSADTHVYGVHTSHPDSEPGVHLYGIGHEGTLVTVVQWAQMGDLSEAPIAEFEETTTTSVAKL